MLRQRGCLFCVQICFCTLDTALLSLAPHLTLVRRTRVPGGDRRSLAGTLCPLF